MVLSMLICALPCCVTSAASNMLCALVARKQQMRLLRWCCQDSVTSNTASPNATQQAERCHCHDCAVPFMQCYFTEGS
jgi:hypothetical protein